MASDRSFVRLGDGRRGVAHTLLIDISANRCSTRTSLSRLFRLMGDTKTSPILSMARGLRGVRGNAFINANGLTRVTRVYRSRRVSLLIFSDRLSPARVGGVRTRASIEMVSQAALVLSVFTRETESGRNGLRIRLTRLGCVLPELANGNVTVSELNNNVNAENPNRAGLRASEQRVHEEVRDLGRRLSSLRGRHRVLHSHEGGSNMVAYTVMNCAGTNGSALVGYLASTNILTRSGLFTALSPASETLGLPDNVAIVVVSAMNLIHELPRRLIRTFHSALRRTTRSSVVLGMYSTSDSRTEARVRIAASLLRSLNYNSAPVMAILGGYSLLSRAVLTRSFGTYIHVDTGGNANVSRLLGTVRGGLPIEVGEMGVLLPFTRTNLTGRVHGGNALVCRRCITRKLSIRTIISRTLCTGLTGCRYR